MTIRFQDLDAQLLVSEPEAPLLSSFPRVADELSIDVLALLADSAVSEHFPPALLQGVDVSSVQLSSQTLDVVVTLNSGEVILYRSDGSSGMYWQSADDELACLEHVAVQDGRRYYPALMVVSSHGSATAASISDIGML
jgi:syntaxin-binding protein 5